jgi:hypothetical protein
MTDDVFLNDTWRAFFHAPSDPDWTYDSYKPVATLGSVDDYWLMHNTISTTLGEGMYFVMREHVFPCWDDKYNIDGGNISIKVAHEDTVPVVTDLVRALVGETLLKEAFKEQWAEINGLSVSPKKAFSIVKLWLASDALADKNAVQLPPKYAGSAMFTKFRDHIQNTIKAKQAA